MVTTNDILVCTLQIQKHTPIKSANQLPNNQLKHLSSSNQSNRLSNGTTNGATAHNRQPHVPIYAKQPVYQQQQQQPHPKGSENGTKVAKFATAKTQSATLPVEKHTKDSCASIVTSTPTPTNNGNAKHPLQSIASSLPPHKKQLSTAAAKKQNSLNHSSLTNSLAAVATQKAAPIVPSSLFAPIQSVNQSKLKPLGENHTALHRSSSSPSAESKTGNNRGPSDDTIPRNSNAVESTISPSIKNKFNDLLSHPTPVRPTNGVGKGKKQTKVASNGNAFAKPKAEPKQSIGKKLSLSGKIPPSNGKRKRSYSQTSHHEALQRIPPRQQQQQQQQLILKQSQQQNGVDTKKQQPVVTKVKREWHAPDSIFFDFKCSYDVNHDENDVGSCSQAFWFRDIPNANLLTREQRIEMKRDNLRRQATQYHQAQTFRNRKLAKLRLLSVTNALNKFKNDRNR